MSLWELGQFNSERTHVDCGFDVLIPYFARVEYKLVLKRVFFAGGAISSVDRRTASKECKASSILRCTEIRPSAAETSRISKLDDVQITGLPSWTSLAKQVLLESVLPSRSG